MANNSMSISTGTIVRVILAVLVVGLLYLVKNVLILFFIAIIIAAAFDPLIDRLQRFKIPRALGMITVYLIFFAFVGTCIFLLYGPITDQIKDMAKAFPDFYSHIQASWHNISGLDQITSAQNIGNTLGSNIGGITKGIGVATSSIFGVIMSIFGGLIGFLLVLLMAFYMTVEENGMKNFLGSLVPASQRAYVTKVISEIQVRMGNWLRGQVILSFIIFMMSYVGLSILNVKYALILALIAGALEIIPFLGPTLSAVPAIFIALSQSLSLAIMVAVLYVIIHQAENLLITPKLMGRITNLNPLVIILSVLAGTRILGIVGTLLAVPAAIAISVIISNIREYRANKKNF